MATKMNHRQWLGWHTWQYYQAKDKETKIRWLEIARTKIYSRRTTVGTLAPNRDDWIWTVNALSIIEKAIAMQMERP